MNEPILEERLVVPWAWDDEEGGGEDVNEILWAWDGEECELSEDNANELWACGEEQRRPGGDGSFASTSIDVPMLSTVDLAWMIPNPEDVKTL